MGKFFCINTSLKLDVYFVDYRYVLKPSALRHAKVIPFNMFDQRFGDIVPSKITIKVCTLHADMTNFNTHWCFFPYLVICCIAV